MIADAAAKVIISGRARSTALLDEDAGFGSLKERRESTGRRRRIYALTEHGLHALEQWRAEPTAELPELRDLALLKA